MKTGYEISFKDFVRLCSEHREDVQPLLQKWFGYSVIPEGKGFRLQDPVGTEMSPLVVHEMIQEDAERQGSIYRLAMTLWR